MYSNNIIDKISLYRLRGIGIELLNELNTIPSAWSNKE